MDTKLRDIIYYFCKHYPRELTRVVLAKLIYLTDVEFYRRYRRQTTSLLYEYDNHGPFTWAIVDETVKMFSDGLIDVLERPSSYGGPKYVYRCKSEYEPRNLDEHTLKVLQDVNSYFSRFYLSDLLDYVYTNPPTYLFKRGDMIDFSRWMPNCDLPTPIRMRINQAKTDLTRALAKTLGESGRESEDYQEDPAELKENSLLTKLSLSRSEDTSKDEAD